MSSDGLPPTRSTVTPAPALRLDSWKEIATHLNHSPRTVRRWEREEGLPVHRHLHRKKGTVYAFSLEVDAWLEGRGTERPPRETGFITPADNAHLAGNLHLGWSEAEIKKCFEYFTLVVERDPDSAPGYAELALAYSRFGLLYDYPPVVTFGRAKDLALKALTLDPGLCLAHAALAVCNLYRAWKWSEAAASIRRAIELNPSNSRGYAVRSACHLVMGRRGEAVEDLDQADRLDPHSPTGGMALAILAVVARLYRIASPRCQEILRSDPSSALAHLLLGLCYARQGDDARGITHCEKARKIGSGQMLHAAVLCNVYAMAGRRDSAERLLDEMVATEKQQYVRYMFLAQASVSLRKDKETFEWLEKAYEQRDPLLVFLKCDPRFEPLSRSARFGDLLGRIGLPS